MALLLTTMEAGNAADLRYSTRVSVAQASNPNHVAVPDNDNEILESLHGQASLSMEGYELDMRVLGSMDITDYRSDDIPDTDTAQLNADVLWKIVPSRFEWYLGDIYMQTTIDSTSNLTPSNQQNINATSFGPNYFVHLDSRSSIVMQGRINDFYYENAETDNTRYIAATHINYEVLSTVSVAAGYEYTGVNYDTGLNVDYERNDIYFSINHHKNFYELDVLLGRSSIDREVLTDLSEARYLLSLMSRRSWTTDVRFTYVSDLSDASNDIFSINSNISQTGDLLLSTTSSLYARKTVALDITKSLSSGHLILSWRNTLADYTDEDDLDQDISRAVLAYEANITSRSRLNASATLQETVYTNRVLPRTDNDTLLGLGYTYLAGRHISLNTRVESNKRDSTSAADTYEDNIILFSIEYRSE